MMMLSAMNEEIDDEDLKEELMRCFSNAPTTVQAIGVLRAIKQRQGENTRLYATRYETVHNRANQLTPKEQAQMSEMIHYVGILLPALKKNMLKKLSSN